MTISCLGPEGTFSERAARIFAERLGAEIVLFANIREAIKAADSGRTDYAVIPLENQIEGVVNAALDALIFDSRLFITQKLSLEIRQSLMSRAERIEDVGIVVSHPQALAQCAAFLGEFMPNAVITASNSTAEGVLRAVEDADVAAIGDAEAGKRLGLNVLRDNIAESDSNFTSFALLSRENAKNAKGTARGAVVFATENKPGELYKVLYIFNVWGVNLTAIHSRPVKDRIDEYVFYVEYICDDAHDADVVISMIRCKTNFFKLLGSFEIIE